MDVLILLQITVMLVFAHIFGGLVKRLHQPPVLGEILGGIILGPTLLGAAAPAVQSGLFPAFGESSRILSLIAYLGLTAFVFIAGLEVDLTCIRRQGKITLVTSISGVILPFAMGLEWLCSHPGYGSYRFKTRPSLRSLWELLSPYPLSRSSPGFSWISIS